MSTTTTDAADQQQRAYATGAEITLFELVTLTVDLIPQGRPNKRDGLSFPFVCLDPAHDAPAPVKQQYSCPDEHGPFQEYELGRARVNADGVHVLATKEEIAAAKTGGMEKCTAEMRIHPVEQVAGHCRPGPHGYRLRLPKKHSTKQARQYHAILDIVARRQDVAVVGEMRIRDSRALYQLVAHRGQLMISELLLPVDLAAVDAQDLPEVDERLTKMADDLIEIEVADFDPDEYGWDATAAVADLVKENTDRPVTEIAAVTTTDGDVIDLLAARLASAKKAKAKKPAKKSAAKKTAKRVRVSA